MPCFPNLSATLAKYTARENLPFDPDELAFVYELLNLRRPAAFRPEDFALYRARIKEETADQNRAMTLLFSKFLTEPQNELLPYSNLVSNIAEIRSVFMLENLYRLLRAEETHPRA